MEATTNPKESAMLGKFEGNEDQSLAERLHLATMDGTCETDGDVASLVGWFGLVEDFEDSDWIVREDDRGFVTVEGPFDHIAIDTAVGGGYFQPARVRFEELRAEFSEWLGDDEDDDDAFLASYEGGRVEARFI